MYAKLTKLKERRDAAEEAYEDEMDTNRSERADEKEPDYTRQNRLQEKFDKLTRQVFELEKQFMSKLRTMPVPKTRVHCPGFSSTPPSVIPARN